MHGATARHVFTAVIADALDDGTRAPELRTQKRSAAAAEERPPAGRAVQRDVTDNDIVFGHEAALLRRIHNDAPARQTFANVVVLSPSSSSVMPRAMNAPKLCPADPFNLI